MNEEATLYQKNLARAGEYFMYSIWIQSQLSDLIILNRHPRIIKKFINIRGQIPATLRDGRMKYWQKDFGEVKKQFEQEFLAKLSPQFIADLNTVFFIRNAIGHSYVSLSRNYLLYRPGNRKKLNKYKKSIQIIKHPDASKPVVYKLDFSNDQIYYHNFNAIKRLDEIHLKTLAEEMRIDHSRIR